MSQIYKGVLIDQSVPHAEHVLRHGKVVGTREATLEGEGFRGKVLFRNIEVTEGDLWAVLHEAAKTIKSPGWFFHLANGEQLYVVMPNAILIATNDDNELGSIVDYAKNHGIHPEQLNLKQAFRNPFA